MISFLIGLAALIAGYFLYGSIVERVFRPDNRPTPAQERADGVDFMVLPTRKVFMIQFLNIAGTGPIFGAIMGAKFGPSSYLWIVLGSIFAGAVYDYMSGMLSMRNGGVGYPELVGKYLGKRMRGVALVFTLFFIILVGAVFVYSPALILSFFYDNDLLWIIIIFGYYVIATLLPIDKVIGRVYPVFGAALLFMAVALFVMLCVKMPNLPEVWDSLDNMMPQEAAEANPIYPCLFITIACGAISGFHATQSPMMARCIATERHGRRVFYGAMIAEGIVALIWAAVGSYFFYASPTPGYQEMEVATGYATAAPKIVALVTQDWLGLLGGILAVMGVIVAPITTGDTALRSARLIVADWLKIDQRQKAKRLYISIPIFLFSLLLLLWQIENPEGFNVIWQYFGWGNQVLSVIGLWTITVYLAGENKCYWVTLLPAMFMTCVCITFLCVSKQAFAIDYTIGCIAGVTAMAATTILFFTHLAKKRAIK